MTPVPVPKEILDFYPLLTKDDKDILKFLREDRGIDLHAVARFRLRSFRQGKDVGVIFPILAKDGKTVLDMYVRLIDRKQFFRLSLIVAKKYHPELGMLDTEYKATHLCFGNHLMSPDKPLMIVEGPLDALRLNSIKVNNVVATFGGMNKQQALHLYARCVYLGYDADDPGRRMNKEAFNMLKEKVRTIYSIDWGVANTNGDSKKVKDAGDVKSFHELVYILNQKETLQQAGSETTL